MKFFMLILALFAASIFYGISSNTGATEPVKKLGDHKGFTTFQFKTDKGNIINLQALKGETEKGDGNNCTHCQGNGFCGEKRMIAKLSIVKASKETFLTLSALKATLTDDNTMRKDRNLSTNANCKRCADEERHVQIQKAFIYEIYKEGDDDYHIIIGDGIDTDSKNNLTIEVSGIPDSDNSDKSTLSDLRSKVENYFGELECGVTYKFSNLNSMEIEVEGSLFFDMDHLPGAVGRNGIVTNTSWEIHPITQMIFKD